MFPRRPALYTVIDLIPSATVQIILDLVLIAQKKRKAVFHTTIRVTLLQQSHAELQPWRLIGKKN